VGVPGIGATQLLVLFSPGVGERFARVRGESDVNDGLEWSAAVHAVGTQEQWRKRRTAAWTDHWAG
jgi:hypothetical protein